jgi:hypothetical protein
MQLISQQLKKHGSDHKKKHQNNGKRMPPIELSVQCRPNTRDLIVLAKESTHPASFMWSLM